MNRRLMNKSKRIAYFGTTIAALVLTLAQLGCESERIVESTEYIEKIQYIEVPADTVLLVDTISIIDTTTTNTVDTVTVVVTISDTVTVAVLDTVLQQVYVYDTTNSVDTVVTVVNHYDTTVMVDTVTSTESAPNASLAYAAMQYHTDPMVFEYINAEFGLTDGWILYLSEFQVEFANKGNGVFEFAGVIDYWTPTWEEFYSLEFYWSMVPTGGDPADPRNWRMDDPAGQAANFNPGLNLKQKNATTGAIEQKN